MELWDAYNANFEKIEGVTLVRGEPVPENTFHLVCDVLVKHADGSFLIMQRDPRKDFYGGMWEATAGGSALVGENPLQCATRELAEETGIISTDLIEIERAVNSERRYIHVEFLCITDWDKDKITLQEGETVDYKWVSQEELLSMGDDELVVTKRIQNYISKLNHN